MVPYFQTHLCIEYKLWLHQNTLTTTHFQLTYLIKSESCFFFLNKDCETTHHKKVAVKELKCLMRRKLGFLPKNAGKASGPKPWLKLIKLVALRISWFSDAGNQWKPSLICEVWDRLA